MHSLPASIVTSIFLLAGAASAQATTYEFIYDPVDILIEENPGGGGLPDAGYTFDITGDISDLTQITSATISVYLNDIDLGTGPNSLHSSRITAGGYTMGYPIWGESNHIASYMDNPQVIDALQSTGSLSVYVYFDPIFIPTFDPYLFDKVSLSVVTSMIPVPGAFWLFASGLIGMAVVSRRSSSKTC